MVLKAWRLVEKACCELVKVQSGINKFSFVVDEVPETAGVDPFCLLIDRMPADNMRKTTQ
jgi:hypothetical protein